MLNALAKWPFQWLTVAGTVIYLAVMVHLNQIPVDVGDGLQHFATAQHSWENPLFLLDHWAKPLFTLLSSPFAQGGFTCWLYFNLLVFTLTCVAGIRLLQHWKVGVVCQALFPLLLISIPDYIYCVLGGMTETFFGLILVAGLLFAVKERWWAFALLLSFAPFARSEGMLVIVLAFCVLIYARKLACIPLLAVGFLIYGGIGMLIDWPFLWYFTKDPYKETAFYGSGHWSHYLVTWTLHFGKITAVLLPFAIFGWVKLLRSERRTVFLPLLLFTLICYGGIVLAHAYFWAYGLKSSIGLTRLATLGIPPFILLLLIGLSELSLRRNVIVANLAMGLIGLACILMIRRNHYPLHAGPFEELVLDAADYVKAHENAVNHVYYMHPLVYWRLGLNPFEFQEKYVQHYFDLAAEKGEFLKEGDVIIRDSQFGGGEQGLPLEQLKKIRGLYPARSFYSLLPGTSYRGERWSAVIYHVDDTNSIPRAHIVETNARLAKTFSFGSEDLYTDISRALPVPASGGIHQLNLTIKYTTHSGKSIFLVLAEKGTEYFQDEALPQNETATVTLKAVTGRSYMLYFYNPDKSEGTISITNATWRSKVEPGL